MKKFKKEHFIILIALAALIAFSYYILPVAKPIVLALITALLLERLVNFIKHKLNIKRTTSVVIVFFSFVLLTLGISSFIVFKSIAHIVEFVENFPGLLTKINEIYFKVDQKIRELISDLPREVVRNLTNAANDTFNSVIDTLREKVSLENITKIAKAVPTFAVNFIVYVLALILFMIDLPNLEKGLKEILKEKTQRNLSLIKQKTEETIYGVARAQILMSLVTVAVAFVGFLILPVSNMFFLLFIIWLVDLLPIVGAIIILVPWGIYALSTGDTFLGVGLIVLGIIITTVRRLIEPKIMSVNIGLSPLAALVSIFVGFKLFGFIGLLAGPLILIIFKSLVEEDVIRINFKI